VGSGITTGVGVGIEVGAGVTIGAGDGTYVGVTVGEGITTGLGDGVGVTTGVGTGEGTLLGVGPGAGLGVGLGVAIPQTTAFASTKKLNDFPLCFTLKVMAVVVSPGFKNPSAPKAPESDSDSGNVMDSIRLNVVSSFTVKQRVW